MTFVYFKNYLNYDECNFILAVIVWGLKFVNGTVTSVLRVARFLGGVCLCQ